MIPTNKQIQEFLDTDEAVYGSSHDSAKAFLTKFRTDGTEQEAEGICQAIIAYNLYRVSTLTHAQAPTCVVANQFNVLMPVLKELLQLPPADPFVGVVFHAKEPKFRKITGKAKLKDFDAVAVVESYAQNVDCFLEHVFKVTNHIDEPWQENETVTPLIDRARSTSVGDMVLVNGIMYGVESFGFGEVEYV